MALAGDCGLKSLIMISTWRLLNVLKVCGPQIQILPAQTPMLPPEPANAPKALSVHNLPMLSKGGPSPELEVRNFGVLFF